MLSITVLLFIQRNKWGKSIVSELQFKQRNHKSHSAFCCLTVFVLLLHFFSFFLIIVIQVWLTLLWKMIWKLIQSETPQRRSVLTSFNNRKRFNLTRGCQHLPSSPSPPVFPRRHLSLFLIFPYSGIPSFASSLPPFSPAFTIGPSVWIAIDLCR